MVGFNFSRFATLFEYIVYIVYIQCIYIYYEPPTTVHVCGLCATVSPVGCGSSFWAFVLCIGLGLELGIGIGTHSDVVTGHDASPNDNWSSTQIRTNQRPKCN